ncbi:MAG: nitroreductase family protein [Actinobacteria bacterium]|jgi:nitroreductase|nr:nitroreductase family protein [Actinomycetota bacterium]MDP7550951.1 nitroreductase family protein [Acidimicrobiales bacterium]MBT3686523.1 nitroreductase family protein [Actinomycetota bacterium]MBT4036541.1 nitroreductase family protein [Actinomycetota bacterium]MBT4278082.1 nitroreductase family protein [Actinomycetota bacterium]|tara:strand:+ start:8506 stop:9111 length:606 start_codon:yes stop_codon:yes gene_type:complete
MSVNEALAARRTCRSFTREPLGGGVIDRLLDRARRTPTAGNCQGVEFLVLEGPGEVAAFWDTTLPSEKHSGFPWPGLLLAPAIVIPFGLPDVYLERYGEDDKVATGLGVDAADWSVPYWLTDAAFAAMALQLLVVEESLGCCFFGLFGNEGAVRRRFDVPGSARSPGAIAIGHPDHVALRPSTSAARSRRPVASVVHHGCW